MVVVGEAGQSGRRRWRSERNRVRRIVIGVEPPESAGDAAGIMLAAKCAARAGAVQLVGPALVG